MSRLSRVFSRRDLFTRTAAGFAGIALASLLEESARAAEAATTTSARVGAAALPQYAPRAKAVIQLFQHGGPSHMDLLDPKPELNARNGQPMPKYFTDLVKLTAHGNLLGSPFKFQPAGQCGVEYSEMLPHTATCADDIAVIRSMHTEHNNHEQALWMMHTGRIVTGRPTHRRLGAATPWARRTRTCRPTSCCATTRPCRSTARATGRAASCRRATRGSTSATPARRCCTCSRRRRRRRARSGCGATCSRKLNDEHLAEHAAIAPDLEARIASYEMAARMQLHAAEALDLTHETRRDARALRHRPAEDRQLRPPLPDRPPAGRAGRAVRADLRRRANLGHAQQERRRAPRAAASRPTSRPPRCSTT